MAEDSKDFHKEFAEAMKEKGHSISVSSDTFSAVSYGVFEWGVNADPGIIVRKCENLLNLWRSIPQCNELDCTGAYRNLKSIYSDVLPENVRAAYDGFLDTEYESIWDLFEKFPNDLVLEEYREKLSNTILSIFGLFTSPIMQRIMVVAEIEDLNTEFLLSHDKDEQLSDFNEALSDLWAGLAMLSIENTEETRNKFDELYFTFLGAFWKSEMLSHKEASTYTDKVKKFFSTLDDLKLKEIDIGIRRSFLIYEAFVLIDVIERFLKSTPIIQIHLRKRRTIRSPTDFKKMQYMLGMRPAS